MENYETRAVSGGKTQRQGLFVYSMKQAAQVEQMQDVTKKMIISEIERIGFTQPPESHAVDVQRLQDERNAAGVTTQTFVVRITF